jgi:drug/metabolite transporter (DMT)-like permease
VDPRLKAVIFLTLVNVLWGMSFPTVKALTEQLDRLCLGTSEVASSAYRVASATCIISLRFGLAFVLLGIFCRSLMMRTRWFEWWAGAWIGTLFLCGLILQTIGLATIPASRSGFLTSLSVVFTPLLVALGHGRRPSRWLVAGIGIASLGVAILTGLILWDSAGIRLAPDAMQVWTIGDTLTTVASLFFSMQIIFIDRYGKQMTPAALTPGMFAAVAILAMSTFASMTCWFGAPDASEFMFVAKQASFWPLIVMLSVFPSLLAFSWMNTYQPLVSAVQAAVIYTMEPVFVSTWALFLPGILSVACGLGYTNETLTVAMLLGGGLILVANVLALGPSE